MVRSIVGNQAISILEIGDLRIGPLNPFCEEHGDDTAECDLQDVERELRQSVSETAVGGN